MSVDAAEQLLDVKSAGRQGDRARACESASTSACGTSCRGWRGNGAAAIHNLMEDAATAEISRSQLWQWVHNEVVLDDGTQVTAELVREVLARRRRRARRDRTSTLAVELFEQVALADEFVDFLTLPAYERI